jgi:hypothetical protein
MRIERRLSAKRGPPVKVIESAVRTRRSALRP